MKRKILITVLSLACMLTCAFGLAACGGNGNPSAHTHEWSQSWEKDDTHHWHNCTASGCDVTDDSQKDGYTEHDLLNGDCVCGYKPKFTAGLQYEIIAGDGTYAVTGIGTAGVKSIVIPSEYEGISVTEIDRSAFSGCTSITSVTIPDSVTVIGNSAFEGCTSLTSVTVPDSVTLIAFKAFKDCSSLTDINIPDSITAISENMFNGCTSLTDVNIPDGVTSIYNSAFEGCSNLSGITLPDGLKTIGSYAFRYCSNLTDITIPEGVTKIYYSAFKGCSSVTHLTIRGATEIDGKTVFEGCPVETAVIYYPYVCSYINNPSLKTVVVTHGEILGSDVLKDCVSLISITIPASVTEISKNAFDGCDSLERVYYGGTAESWAEIDIKNTQNDCLINATRYYYSETKPTEEGNYWHFDADGVTPVIWSV